jgi:PAS domain S-box-containing protein
MTIWSWIHFISFIIYVLLFSYILGKNYKAYINIIAAALILCFALWSFGFSIMYTNFSTLEVSRVMHKIAGMGWVFFSSLYLLLVLELTEQKKMSRSPMIVFLLFIIPVVLYMFFLKGEITKCCDKKYFGYAGAWQMTIWANLFYVYYVSFFVLDLYFILRYIRKENNKDKINTAVILMTTMFFCFVVGTITSIVLKIKNQYVPIEANVYLIFFAISVFYAMQKYEFLSIAPSMAADLIINTMNDGLILFDKKGNVVSANYSVHKIFDCDNEEKEDCLRVIPEFLIKKILSSQQPIVNEEVVITTIKDNKKTLLLSVSVLSYKKEVRGYVCILKDITDLKIAKNELEETIVKLIKSNKELEQFAYVASHDLKEPLRMVTSYVQLLQKRYTDKLDSDANDFINFAVEGAKRMYELIDGLLEYSRVITKEVEIEEVNIGEIIEEVLFMLKIKIEQKHALIKKKGNFPKIKGNKIHISRLFQNLIDNSLKFCKEKPVIEVGVEKKDGGYLFYIRDNGIGIRKEFKERIFDIFQRINPREEYEGTGIGLSICKKIVEKYKGSIWVESEGEGKGSTFYFILPEK